MSFLQKALLIILTTILVTVNIKAQHADHDHDHDHSIDDATIENNIYLAELRFVDFFSCIEFENAISERTGIDPAVFKLNNLSLLKSVIWQELQQYHESDYDKQAILDGAFESVYSRLDLVNFETSARPSYDPFEMDQTRQYDGPCVNMDFETGDLEGWTLLQGDIVEDEDDEDNEDHYDNEMYTINSPGAHHTIVGPGIDTISGLSQVNPAGGQYSLLLGDATGTGARSARLVQTFLVSEENAAFTYSYSVVLADPANHDSDEKPFFKVWALDMDSLQWIDCATYSVVAGSGLAAESWEPFDYAFTHEDSTYYNNGWYKDWETVFVPLENYIGRNVRIFITVADCALGGHFGYAYIDAECGGLNLIEPGTLICKDQSISLSAPEGASAYLWNTGETSQSISVSEAGDYSVNVAPVQGAACSIDLYASLTSVPSAPHAAFTLSDSSICLGEEIQFTNNSYIENPTAGLEFDMFEWNFDDYSHQVYDEDVTYNYGDIGTYDVELIVEMIVDTLGSCWDTAHHTVNVHPYPVTSFESTIECFDIATSFTDNSTIEEGNIANWDWDFYSSGTVNATDQNPQYVYTSSGTQYATLTTTSEFDCATTWSDSVQVHHQPEANFGTTADSYSIHNPEVTFTNLSELNVDNNWTFVGLGQSTDVDPMFSFPTEDQGTYEVCLEVASEFGCIDTICKNITIDGISTLFVPNSFTPNEDGINDLIGPVSFGLAEDDFYFSIYDRGGTVIFTTTDPYQKWNGSMGTYYAPDGVYTFAIKSKDKYTGAIQFQTGSIVLLR